MSPAARADAVAFLREMMDRYHLSLDVFSDFDSAGNHFPHWARIGPAAGISMDAECPNPQAGRDCLRAQFRPEVFGDWGGFYFLTGAADGAGGQVPNWGTEATPGVDLSGATSLSFWARGERGGERLEFFALGVGRGSGSGAAPYPGSSRKVSTGVVTLSDRWEEHRIDLDGLDLSNVLGGFGWAASASQMSGPALTVYIDEVRYDKPRLDDPRFILSYESPRSPVLRNTAYLYDNALALLAFLSVGEIDRARLLADAIVFAQRHDRHFADGRLRNAYRAGDLVRPEAGQRADGQGPPPAALPGWFDPEAGRWNEDIFQISSHVGNAAWAMIALLAIYEQTHDPRYLDSAESIGSWIEACCRDASGPGGYNGGFDGWEPDPAALRYKSTEHNIDVSAAFERLYALTGNARWRDGAMHARAFVLAMWDDQEGKFWIGTAEDGVTIAQSVVPLDVQPWAIMGLNLPQRYWRALIYAERNHWVDGGYDFNRDRDGVWYEGTAQMAAAYAAIGRIEEWRALIKDLKGRLDRESGGLPAASRDGLSTGLGAAGANSSLTRYNDRQHIGATAWFILAALRVNPFWLGSPE